MASLQQRNSSFRVQFCYHGKLHGFTLGAVSLEEAKAKTRQVDYLLMRLKQKLIHLPAGTDIVSFVEHDGSPPNAGPCVPSAPRQVVTIARLRDRYFEANQNGSMETNTLYTRGIHFRHLARLFGESFPVCELTSAAIQDYVNRRARAVSSVTIRKELATLRAAWNWGLIAGLTSGTFANKGLRFPKVDEKLPFMTMAEILWRIDADGESAELWESLYLQADEMLELLDFVMHQKTAPWVYPMFCFAAQTGARRSEIARARCSDVDFAANVITIREKKRRNGERTSRRIPISKSLKQVLLSWLKVHPGGPSLFCHEKIVHRSKKRSSTTGHKSSGKRPTSLKERKRTVGPREPLSSEPLTVNELHHYFKSVLQGSKWQRIRGLHTLRHGFISACASRGVDQRLVEAWAGHMSIEMSRRYSHLWPSTQQEAMEKVFG